MAIVNRSSVPNANEVAIPSGVYVLRVKEATVEPSKSSGKNQIILACEIVSPSTVQVGDTEVNIQGREHNYYLSLSQEVNPKTKKAGVDYTLDVLASLGLGDSIDTEAPDLTIFDSLEFRAVLESKERAIMTKDANGRQVPVLENGRPVTRGWQIEGFASNILGRA